MAKDFYQPLFNDEFLLETSGISLAAAGAYVKFKAKAWNAATRGELCRPLGSYAQMFGCTADQAQRVIDELTTGDSPVLVREDMEDGNIRLTHESTRHRDRISRVRSAARQHVEKRDVSECVPQKGHQNTNKPLDIDLDLALCSNRGMQGGDGSPVLEVSPGPSDEIDDHEFASWPLDHKVRHWLNRWTRFPYVNTSPKDVSTVVRMVEKWDWDFVKACLSTALDNGARLPVAYAEKVAEKRAAEHFLKAEKAAKPSRKWRSG